MSTSRRHRIEKLEPRRLLAVVTVGNELDEVNGDVTSISSLLANDGGDGISLREAVLASNNTLGEDTVQFGSDLSGQTIALDGSPLAITDPLEIDASALESRVVIDANLLSRVMIISDPNTLGEAFGFTLRHVSVIRGATNGLLQPGGGVHSTIMGHVLLDDVLLANNRTQGIFSSGGGISTSGDLTVTTSTISGNQVFDSFSGGGGIEAKGLLTISNSVISDNHAAGDGGGLIGEESTQISDSVLDGNTSDSSGGGLNISSSLTITDSTIRGNDAAVGGGIWSTDLTLERSVVANNTAGSGAGIVGFGPIVINESEIHENSASGDGGGLYSLGGAPVTIQQSTLSGNTANRGGGVWTRCAPIFLEHSTVSGNQAIGTLAVSAGLYTQCGAMRITGSTITDNHVTSVTTAGGINGLRSGDGTTSRILGSIVSGNTAAGQPADISTIADDTEVDYSLIGAVGGTGIDDQTGEGNLINVDPRLGPLADNGGPTATHALLPGSPAIDAGDPAVLFDPAESDQRGLPFVRVADGDQLTAIVVDIGAYEAQIAPSADFDEDLDIDGADFLIWQRGFGTNEGAALSQGNSDDDSDVDASDLAAWRVAYNQAVPLEELLNDADGFQQSMITGELAAYQAVMNSEFSQSQGAHDTQRNASVMNDSFEQLIAEWPSQSAHSAQVIDALVEFPATSRVPRQQAFADYFETYLEPGWQELTALAHPK